jgi:hypothetical protein
MHTGHDSIRRALDRRAFLVAGGVSYCGLDLVSLVAANQPAVRLRRRAARSAILVWLSGGASHIDTWDMKPRAPVEYRGEFRPIQTSAPGLLLCEHLPRLARQAHHLAVIRSLGHYGRGTGDHHAGYYYNLTGREPDPSFRALLNDRRPQPSDWPFIGSVVEYKRPAHPYLPSLISLPRKPGFPTYTRPGQFAARLGSEHDALYVLGSRERPLEFVVPELTLHGDIGAVRLQSRRHLLGAVDRAFRAAEVSAPTAAYGRQQQRAYTLLGSCRSRSAFDLSREPEVVRERYGQTVNGMSMLLARRLAEAGVPFITIFWKEDPTLDRLCNSGGGWDTHGNNFNCLRQHLLPELDRCLSALLEDLSDRGLLDETLVIVNSEMGRMPRVGDRRSGGVSGAGRDHWTNCMSVLLAGGGVRGGQAYGASDAVAGYPADRPVAPEDIARTIYHALGIDNLQASDREGRPFDLLPEGAPLLDLFH